MNNDDQKNKKKEFETKKINKSEIQYVSLNITGMDDTAEEIDIYELFFDVWNQRNTIYKVLGVFIIIGLFFALLSIEEYSTNIKLLPETQPELPLGRLGSLATQFGISAAPQSSGDVLAANLYSEIIRSNAFLLTLMDYEVVISSHPEKLPLKTYITDHQKKPFVNQILLFPFVMRDLITNSSKSEGDLSIPSDSILDQSKKNRLVSMSNTDWETLREIRQRILTSMDNETGIITVSVKMQDPLVAADIADEIVQRLSEYIIQNRTEKARRDVEFIEDRFNDSKERFEQVQRELAEFNDANRGQLTAVARTEEQLLQSRYNLNFNLYNSMAERLEEARIKLQEDTPVINILEPASIPDERSEPNRILILILFTSVGLILGLSIIFGRKFFNQIRSDSNNA